MDPSLAGYGLTAFIEVTLERPQHRAKFIAGLEKFPEVQECHHVAGSYDYLLKVRCRDTSDLDLLLSKKIKGLPGIARTRTTVVLGTIKESVVTPIAAPFPAKDPES